MSTIFKIHPAIGSARVGNSDEFYLSPESPGALPFDPKTGKPIYTGPDLPGQNIFHDTAGALKKQAARFKVYAYESANPTDPGSRVQVGTTKIGGRTVTAIEWTVHLANKKACWFQFEQLTGSGLDGDAGYLNNNAANPGGANGSLPFNRLRENKQLGLTADPAALTDPKRRQLILDPGSRTVSGPNAKPQDFSIAPKGLRPFEITTLGRILTDGECSLVVLAGSGHSGTTDKPVHLANYANNSGWFDDVSDGPVGGALVLDDGSKVAIDVPAWVLCGPPKYAPEIINVVSMYDTMYDLFVRKFGLNPKLFKAGQFQPDYRPDRASEINALLIRPNLYQYVAAISGVGRTRHRALPSLSPQEFAKSALEVLRGPDDRNKAGLMPKLAGDNPLSQFQSFNYLSLTATQLFVLSQYAKGLVSNSAPALGEGMLLDQASLGNCVGGAFCPGIEMTWLSRNPTIYQPLPANPSLSDAFRIRHKNLSGGLTVSNGADNDYSAGLEPGDITKYMAQPWQADFNECSVQPIAGQSYWWWPAQRPHMVFPAANPAQRLPWTRIDANDPNGGFDDLQMVTNWKDLGFILNIGAAGTPKFVEIERNQKAITDFSVVA
jgi:hypothetical protein